MKNKILIGASLALLLVVGWWASRSSAGTVEALIPGSLLAGAEAPGDAVLVGPEAHAGATEGSRMPQREALEVEAASEGVEADPWAGELGGVTGRIVEEDGSAVPGISVAFIEADGNLLIGSDWVDLGEAYPELILERTLTDDEGRFQLNGGYDDSYHGLGIDLRGPRSTLRIVDSQVNHRELTDLGDIVLRSGCTVTGRVTDEGGSPVAGVRVRLTHLVPDETEPLMMLGVQDFRSDCAVGISVFVHAATHSPVVELPPLIRRHLDDLPLPTTVTDADGRYTFKGAPIGKILLAIDKRGALGMLRNDETAPGEIELQDAVLRAGRTIAGEVFDGEGEPIPGVDVLVGAEIAGVAAILQPAGVTDAEGRFSIAGIPLEGNLMACARRAQGEPWVGVIGEKDADMEIELESAFPVTVRVLDLAGEPVTRARVALEVGYEEDSPMLWAIRFGALGATQRPSRFKETEPGVYVCQDVTPGTYEVSARSRDLSMTRRTVELRPGEAEVTLTCEPGRVLELTVRDGVTGAAVRDARASIVQMDDLFRAVAVARTNAEGVARLGPFRDLDGAERFTDSGNSAVLIEHPRYADASITVHESTLVTEVSLVPGGELRGRVVWGAGPPREIYMLALARTGDYEPMRFVLIPFAPPRIARTGLDGGFRVSNLPAGTYSLEVYQRMLGGDPLDFGLKGVQPVTVHRQQDLIVETGATTELVIDLGADGTAGMARLVGWVRLDGKPVEGAKVYVYSKGSSARATTDVDGAYETQLFLVGPDMTVRIEAEVESGTTRTLRSSELQAVGGDFMRLDVDATTSEVLVRVTAAENGEPLEGVEVGVGGDGFQGYHSSDVTDGSGEVSLKVVGEGKGQITANAPERVATKEAFSLEGKGGRVVVEITMDRSVVCAGICDLTSLEYGDLGGAYLQVKSDGGSKGKSLDRADVRDDGRAAFRIDGLAPGSYTARIWCDGIGSEPIEIELSGEGARDLLLVYEPGE